MKANFQHLGFETVSESFLCYWVKSPLFGFHWHYHPELEITYVHHGHGTRLVGNNVSEFREGDFVLLGSNLPHTWISDDDFNQMEKDMEVIVLQFPPDLFSQSWLELPEMAALKYLLSKVDRGITFSKSIKEQAAELLLKMVEAEGFKRFQLLLSLLNTLGRDQEMTLLASTDYSPLLSHTSEERILTVCRFIHDHFTESIKLEKVADLAHMNATAFCRFFKKMTGQSLTEYITELRLGKASNLLINESRLSISEIAFLSGFNSQTLFNRSFLKRKGMTPRQFRQRFE